MGFKIPFTFSDIETSKRQTKIFSSLVKNKNIFSSLSENLKSCYVEINKEEYLSICIATLIFSFLILSTIFTSALLAFGVKLFYFWGAGAALIFSIFILFNQINYPNVYVNKKVRDTEKNLMAAMQDVLVQLNSGIPIFEILTNIAFGDYGAVSTEFKKAVKEMNSGKPQIQAIDDLAEKNKSIYFRRVLWQISNGMRSGSDMSMVIKEGINSLSKEQAIQIQSYGSRLSPMIMFYMLIAVIIPVLAITFLTVIASMLGIAGDTLKLVFGAVLLFVMFMQILFLGAIGTRRPSLI